MFWIIFDLVGVVLLAGFFFGVDAALKTAIVLLALVHLALAALIVLVTWLLFGWWLAGPMLLLQLAIILKTWR